MAEPGQGGDTVKDLERRIGRLESEKAATEDFGLYLVDEDMPDGRMFYQGRPVIIRPGESLVIHKQARRR